MIPDQGILLIRDALNRLLRTVLQQLVVAVPPALAYLASQPDLLHLEPWKVAFYGVYHVTASGIVAFIHRAVLDPSKIPSAVPPTVPTPALAEPYLAPPYPKG